MPSSIVDDLYKTIASRKKADPETSYTAQLFSKGHNKVAEKFGEEAVELVIAAVAEPDKIVSESADVLYHMLVLWADVGVKPEEVWAELRRRDGMSGLMEKASRAQ